MFLYRVFPVTPEKHENPCILWAKIDDLDTVTKNIFTYHEMFRLVFDVTCMFVVFYEYNDTQVRFPIQGTSIPSVMFDIQLILMMSDPLQPTALARPPLVGHSVALIIWSLQTRIGHYGVDIRCVVQLS